MSLQATSHSGGRPPLETTETTFCDPEGPPPSAPRRVDDLSQNGYSLSLSPSLSLSLTRRINNRSNEQANQGLLPAKPSKLSRNMQLLLANVLAEPVAVTAFSSTTSESKDRLAKSPFWMSAFPSRSVQHCEATLASPLRERTFRVIGCGVLAGGRACVRVCGRACARVCVRVREGLHVRSSSMYVLINWPT